MFISYEFTSHFFLRYLTASSVFNIAFSAMQKGTHYSLTHIIILSQWVQYHAPHFAFIQLSHFTSPSI